MKSAQPSPAQRAAAIRAAIAAIPRGCVASYGEIARRAGLPGRARLVGHVLGRSPDATLPWQRVVRADGRIAFAPGSADFRRQVRLLAAEGVLVHGGRVDLARFGWERDLDRLLWAPPAAGLRSRGLRHRNRT
ncbi:MAG: cysteine methyltransferase [Xanthomonadales bacterium]|nr:MAG: cysteine methyltransferase [Dokdonella sp.]MBC6943220.1 cysteine methyltransferase [Xanthomonadales bacterium]MCC6595639.1 MGMT family protein [Rhodanobacteraceae bacterium]MDL1870173.1 cysteine methyltransferase [Gammaproteobacteria bacterium PRO6]